MKSIALTCVFITGLCLTGCKKEEVETPAEHQDQEITVDSEYQFRGSVGSNSYHFTSNKNAALDLEIDRELPDAQRVETNYGSSFKAYLEDHLQVELIKKGLEHDWDRAKREEFLAFFEPGLYPFHGDEGFEFNYTDEDGVVWSTSNYWLDHDKDSIEIVAWEETDTYLSYDVRIKVLCRFSCELRNGQGETLQVTDAEFLGKYGN